MSGKKWQRRFISFILELRVGIRTFFLLTDQSMFVGLEVVFTGRQSVVWTCLFRKTEVQQKESQTSFFPAGTLSQSCAGLLLKLHCIPHGLLGSFVPSLICSTSRSVCLHGGTQGNHICIHHLAASPPLNAVLRVWGSSSCSMSKPNCLPHRSERRSYFMSPLCSNRVTNSHRTGNEIHIFWIKPCNSKTLCLAPVRAFCKACRSISSWDVFPNQAGQIRYKLFSSPPTKKECFWRMLCILWPADTIDAKKC